MEPYEEYLKLVQNGLTPFRNGDHMIAVMISDTLDLKLTEEEEGLKKAIHEVLALKEVVEFKCRNFTFTVMR